MGSTVIDELVAILRLDAKGFAESVDAANKAQKKLADGAAAGGKAVNDLEKKLADEQKRRAKEMEARAKSVAQGFHSIRNEALGMLAVFTGITGIKQFVGQTIATAAGLDRMSETLGMSTKELSEWQLANKNAGGTTEGMTAQIKDATTELAKFQSGGSSDKILALLKWGAFSGANIDIDQLKTGTDVLMARAKVLQALSKMDPAKALMAASEIGVSDDTYQLMKQGPEAIRRMREEQAKLAEEMAKAAKPAEELRKKLDSLQNSFDSSATKILTAFTPALKQAVEWMGKLADKIAAPETSDFIGGSVAKVLAFFGNEEAANAVRINEPAKPGEKTSFGFKFGKKSDLDAQERASGGAGKAPRGIRNNNPGNIEYGPFAKRYGATGSDGRFAIFPTMEAGQAAERALLGGYLSSGTDTVRKVINKWAPSSENNTAAYVAAVAKQMGVSPDQALNSSHVAALAEAINSHENGTAWVKRNVQNAVALSATAGRGAFQGGGAQQGAGSSTTEVKIAQINVQTQATDAAGIARDIGPAVMSHSFVTQANNGVN